MKIDPLGTRVGFEPVIALVVYEGTRDDRDCDEPDSVIVARHNIGNGGALLPARIIAPEDIRDFFSLARCAERANGELLPAGIVSFGETSLVWMVPAASREMYFKLPKLSAISGKRAANPALLFSSSPGNLHVFALDSDEWPTVKTKLYRAPFCNVFDGGRLCLPAGAVVSPVPQDVRQNEKILFESFGTHSNGNVVKYRGGHDALWKRLARTGEKFNPAWLVPDGRTVGDLLNESSEMDD